jgi:hypothetical protein
MDHGFAKYTHTRLQGLVCAKINKLVYGIMAQRIRYVSKNIGYQNYDIMSKLVQASCWCECMLIGLQLSWGHLYEDGASVL